MNSYVANVIWALSLALAMFIAGYMLRGLGPVAILAAGLVLVIVWLAVYFRIVFRKRP